MPMYQWAATRRLKAESPRKSIQEATRVSVGCMMINHRPLAGRDIWHRNWTFQFLAMIFTKEPKSRPVPRPACVISTKPSQLHQCASSIETVHNPRSNLSCLLVVPLSIADSHPLSRAAFRAILRTIVPVAPCCAATTLLFVTIEIRSDVSNIFVDTE
jgi:hypothetical protein